MWCIQSDLDKTSHYTDKSAVETEESCEVKGSAESQCDARQESSTASETITQQTKPKKLTKKQLLAEQRRKDRFCTADIVLCAFVTASGALFGH